MGVPETIIEAFDRPRPTSRAPARQDGPYVGRYRNRYLGEVRVEGAGSRLRLSVGSAAFRLRHWTGDTFAYRANAMPAGFTTGVRFQMSSGRATSVELEEVSDTLGGLGIARR